MNYYGVRAIYVHEMSRFFRTLMESIASAGNKYDVFVAREQFWN